MGKALRLGMRAWLLLLVAVAILPVLAFSAFTVHHAQRAQSEALNAALQQRARAAANALDQRLGMMEGALIALARTRAAETGALDLLYDSARRLLPAFPHILAITLIGPDGAQVFNTLQPFGRQLPPSGDLAAARKVFETGGVVLSGPFTGSVSNEPVMSVGVPVMIDGRVTYCLRMITRVAALGEVLNRQGLPGESIATLANGKGIIVARTRSPETTIGTPVSPSLLAAITAGRFGLHDGITKEGMPVRTALGALRGTEWSVAVAMPAAVLEAPLRRSIALMAAGLALSLAVGTAAAWWLARRLAGEVALAEAASAALIGGAEPPVIASRIREFGHLGQAVVEVKNRERAASLALADAVVAHQQVAAELSQARLDQLTGLPSRGMFLEQAEASRRRVAGNPRLRLALLFVDLDGFKRVNDTLGHDRGDAILVEAAAIIRSVLRETDIAGRLGGDEFVICVAGPSETLEAAATAIAGRLVHGIGGIGDGIGCSIGIALAPAGCSDLACSLRRADQAMYDAKHGGKNRWSLSGESCRDCGLGR